MTLTAEMSTLLHRLKLHRSSSATRAPVTKASTVTVSDGHNNFIEEKAGNGSGPSYQDASGAPVERSSPLGYAAGGITVAFINFSMMVGTGVYSTREIIPYL